MSWFTLSWAIFLNGVLVSTASGAMGLNHRKNGVINLGLAGLMSLGVAFSNTIAKVLNLNPYWSIPVCILVGCAVNIVLNIGYISLLRRKLSPTLVSLGSAVAFGVLVLLGKWFLLNQVGFTSMALLLKGLDFSLFKAPGVLIIATVTMLVLLALQFILSPVVDDGPRGFDKWDMVVYAVSGAAACISGALYPFWFSVSWQAMLILPLTGVLFGGLDKKLNPTLGGFVSASLALFTSQTTSLFGDLFAWTPWLMSLVLLLISSLFYPRGLVGSFRRIVEHGY